MANNFWDAPVPMGDVRAETSDGVVTVKNMSLRASNADDYAGPWENMTSEDWQNKGPIALRGRMLNGK